MKKLTRKVRAFYKKHREVIVYILLGGVATLLNWVTAFLLQFCLDEQVVWQNGVINTLAWIVSNAYAYLALRKWVFRSRDKHIVKECARFFGSRIFTWILEVVLMAVAVNALHLNFWLSKIISGLIVFVTNYLLSKLLVFHKKRRKRKKTAA